MLAGAMSAVSAVADKAGDMAGDVAGKAKEMAGFGGPPGADKLKELSSSIKDADKPVTQLKETLKAGVPAAPAEAAKKSLTGFVETVQGILDGKDSGNLAPSGAACLASMWVSSIKTKLGKLKEEMEDFATKAAEAPAGVAKELGSVSETADSVLAAIKKTADAPGEAVKKLTECMAKPAEMGGAIDVIESSFGDVVKTALDAIGNLESALAGIIAKIVSMVEAIVNDIMAFLVRAPKKLTSAFKPPVPICCCVCCGPGKTLEDLKDNLEKVSSAVDLTPIVEAAKKVKTSMEGVDLKPAKDTMAKAKEKMSEALGPAKEAAEKAAGGADKLRAAAGAADGPAAIVS